MSVRSLYQVVHRPRLLAVKVVPHWFMRFWKRTEFTKLIRLLCLSGFTVR